MESIHISEAEAVRDFAAVMARVRSGVEIIIDSDASSPVAVLRPATQPHGRLLSESMALAKAHAEELGYTPVMDDDFAADMEEIIRNRSVRKSAWD